MAHEVVRMFSAIKTPWHIAAGLTTEQEVAITAEALTAQDAIVTAGMDWEVQTVPLYTRELVPGFNGTPDQQIYVESDQGVAVRKVDDGRLLGHVGNDYTPIQNRDLFGFADVLLDQGDLRFETAGVLRDHKVVWVLAQVAREVVIDGDQHVPYLLLTSSHDGSMAATATLTPIRVVCMNTLNFALNRTKNSFKVRHTANARAKMAEARQALGISYEYLDGFEAEVEALMNQPVSDPVMEAIIIEVLPESESKRAENRRETERTMIRQLWHGSRGNVGRFHGTAWGAVNAVSEWEQWNKRIPEKAVREAVLTSRIAGNRHLEATRDVHRALVAVR